MTVSECCLIKLFPYILSEKYIYVLALEMASRGNQHCASCIGTLSFPIESETRHAECSAQQFDVLYVQLPSLKLDKLPSIEDRGQTDRVAILASRDPTP